MKHKKNNVELYEEITKISVAFDSATFDSIGKFNTLLGYTNKQLIDKIFNDFLHDENGNEIPIEQLKNKINILS